MNTLNKSQLENELNNLWNRRDSLTHKEFFQEASNLYARFEMRLDDLIAHLSEIRKDHGNVKVLKEHLNSGSLHLANIHVQKRNDSFNEWAVSIY